MCLVVCSSFVTCFVVFDCLFDGLFVCVVDRVFGLLFDGLVVVLFV